MKQKTKEFIKAVIIVIAGLVAGAALISCGGSTGGGSGGNIAMAIDGKIQNMAAPLKPSQGIPRHGRAVINSTFSTLSDIQDPIRLPDITASQGIIINTSIKNIGEINIPIGTSYTIEIESMAFITKEAWVCMVHYDCLGGSCSMGISTWEVLGGDIMNPVPVPALPGCDNTAPSDPAFVCDASVYECASPYWAISYTPPGNGLHYASVTINEIIDINEIIEQAQGMAGGSLDVRNNKYARWAIYSPAGILLDQKDYIFNVLP